MTDFKLAQKSLGRNADLLRPHFARYTNGADHVQACFFWGLVGTSSGDSEEAKKAAARNLVPVTSRPDLDGRIGYLDGGDDGSVWRC